MERVLAISEEGGGLDEGRGSGSAQENWWPARSSVIADQLQILSNMACCPTNTVPAKSSEQELYTSCLLALLSPVRVYKPLRDHVLSILIEIRFLSCQAPPSGSELAGTRLIL